MKLQANPNQAVGSSGVEVSPIICKAFIEAVKHGDMEKFSYELMRNQIEVRDVIDSNQFNQNLVFSAVQGNNEENAIHMIKYLVSLGVDFKKKDNLK